jgi:hypothetical protein
MSLGGSKSTKTTNPEWVDRAAQSALGQAQQTARIGYTPYYGPDVAAFTPQQNAAFEGTNQAASAFGMPTSQGNGMPPPETFAGGVQGYSSAPIYQQSVNALQQNNPQQYAAIMSMFEPQAAAPQGLLSSPTAQAKRSSRGPSVATQRRVKDAGSTTPRPAATGGGGGLRRVLSDVFGRRDNRVKSYGTSKGAR